MASTALTRIERGTDLAAPIEIDAARLLERWQEGRSPQTQRAYAQDVAHFARWLTEHLDAKPALGPGEAIDGLLRLQHGHANELGRAYRSAMVDDKLAPATVNRRLAALRSLVTVARQFGMIGWALEIKSVTAETYRDTKGPGTSGVQALVDAAAAQEDPFKAARDVVIVRLLYDIALRRGEAAALQLEHYDSRRGIVQVLGKGKRELKPITLPAETQAALKAYVHLRGKTPGPLLLNLWRGGEVVGLTGDGIYHIIKSLGGLTETTRHGAIDVRPHGLRHTSITDALDKTKGDVRAVRKHSRHAKLETLIVYDDARQDLGGEVARKVAGGVKSK